MLYSGKWAVFLADLMTALRGVIFIMGKSEEMVPEFT
jgi:hypothetical protein